MRLFSFLWHDGGLSSDSSCWESEREKSFETPPSARIVSTDVEVVRGPDESTHTEDEKKEERGGEHGRKF